MYLWSELLASLQRLKPATLQRKLLRLCIILSFTAERCEHIEQRKKMWYACVYTQQSYILIIRSLAGENNKCHNMLYRPFFCCFY